jgi:hypothetical protein
MLRESVRRRWFLAKRLKYKLGYLRSSQGTMSMRVVRYYSSTGVRFRCCRAIGYRLWRCGEFLDLLRRQLHDFLFLIGRSVLQVLGQLG